MAFRIQGVGATGRLAVAALAFLLGTGGVRAEGKHAALVVDANSGKVLHAAAADAPRHPASLAKLMTLYIVFEQMEQGRLSPQTRITFSANAAAAPPSRIEAEEGEQIALIDAIKLLITKSANDVAVAIAEHIAGSEEKFARLMTQKARQIGMAATTFRNASGLHDEAQVTTARDMITLALRLQDEFPRYYSLFSTRTFTYKGDTYRNHNTLLFHYPGTRGLKTGYIRASGFNLAASVRRGEREVVGVVFGGATAAKRNATMRTLLNLALLRATTVKTRKPKLIAAADPAPTPAPPPPVAVRRPSPAVARAPEVQAPPAAPPEAREKGPRIEIARVRPVLVGRPPAAPEAGQPAPWQPSSIDDVLARFAADPSAPQANPPQWTAASADQRPSPPNAAIRGAAPLVFDPVEVRGAAPSTLDAQAANLARGSEAAVAPAPPVPAPAAAPAAFAEGAFQIQIGAYHSAAEAERQLAAVRGRAGELLIRHKPLTQEVRQGGKVLYRARYAGFEARAAASACSTLKRLKIDCLVMRAE